MTVKDKILQGRTYLGIELGSTRIKAVLIDDSFSVIASGRSSGKIALRTAVGHILLMISTGAYKPAIKTLQKT